MALFKKIKKPEERTERAGEAPLSLEQASLLLSPQFEPEEELLRAPVAEGQEERQDLQSAPASLTVARQVAEQVRRSPQVAEEPLLAQLAFPFDRAEQESIAPFYLDESIEVLGLSPLTYKTWMQNGRRYVRDLLHLAESAPAGVKSGDKAYIDETLEKLQRYIADRSLTRSYSIDFAALLRIWLGGLERKELFCFLQPYGLEGLFPLSSADEAAVKQLSGDKRYELSMRLARLLQTEERGRFLQQRLAQICEAFIRPWMGRRWGIASEEEIIERLERVADDRQLARAALRFLSEVFSGGRFLFHNQLLLVEEGLYAIDTRMQADWHQLIARASSYFYRSDVSYQLQELRQLLLREFCQEWQAFSPSLIEKALCMSHRFCLYRSAHGELRIRGL